MSAQKQMENWSERIKIGRESTQQCQEQFAINRKQARNCTEHACSTCHDSEYGENHLNSELQQCQALASNKYYSKYFKMCMQFVWFTLVITAVIPITNCQGLPNKFNVANPSLNLVQFGKPSGLMSLFQSQPKNTSSSPSTSTSSTPIPSTPPSAPTPTHFNVPNLTITIPAQKTPIQFSLSNRPYFIIDIIDFVGTQIFKAIKIFMIKFYQQTAAFYSNIERVYGTKVNSTYQIYHIVYSLLNNQWNILQIGFGFDKEKLRLDVVYAKELLTKFKVRLEFNDTSFDIKQSKLNSDIQKAYNLITKDPLYSSNLSLISVSVSQSGNSPKQLSNSRYNFKFFDKSYLHQLQNSTSTNPNPVFQQVQFVYQSPIPYTTSTSPTPLIRILTPPISYKYYNSNLTNYDPSTLESFQFILGLTLAENYNITNFTISSIEINSAYSYIYRIELQIMNESLVYCQIDGNGIQPPMIIDIREVGSGSPRSVGDLVNQVWVGQGPETIISTKIQFFSKKFQTVIRSPSTVSVLGTPTVDQLLSPVIPPISPRSFPLIGPVTRTVTTSNTQPFPNPQPSNSFSTTSTRSTTTTTTTTANNIRTTNTVSSIARTSSTDQTQLTIDEIVLILSNYLKVKMENVINVTIVERQTLENMIDCYKIDFIDGATKQSKRLVFDVARKRSKFGTFLASRIPILNQYMPGITYPSIQIQPVSYFITNNLNYTLDYSNATLGDRVQKVVANFQDSLKNMLSISNSVAANISVLLVRNTAKKVLVEVSSSNTTKTNNTNLRKTNNNNTTTRNISVVFCEIVTTDNRICPIAIWLDLLTLKIYAIDYIQRGFLTIQTNKNSPQFTSIPYLTKIQNSARNQLQNVIKNQSAVLNFVLMKHRVLSVYTNHLQFYYETVLYDGGKDTKGQGVTIKISIVYVYNFNQSYSNTVNNILLHVVGQIGLNNKLVILDEKYQNQTNCQVKQDPIPLNPNLTTDSPSSTPKSTPQSPTFTCKSCVQGFTLTKQNVCIPIANNCMRQSGVLCLFCKVGYVLNDYYRCQ